ncbi:MAG: antibiotic biosynthesis monooxygenase [Methanomicrobiales archaeon]|nr:antibiotic biosynthesis monooxygenase [Methanomicrobiales archaeon]
MADLTVVAKITAKDGMAEFVHGELRKLIEPTCTKDAGCISYVLYRDLNNPLVYFFLENWESEELLDRHLASEHFQSFVKATEGKVEQTEVHLLAEAG